MGKSMSAGPLSDAAPSGTIADQLGTSQYAVDAPGAGGPSPVAQIVAAVQGASDDDKKKACGALVFVSLVRLLLLLLAVVLLLLLPPPSPLLTPIAQVVLVISTSGNTPTRKKASSNYVPGGACMTTGANFAGVKSQCRFPFSVVLTSGANAGKLKTYTECTADAYAFGSGIVDGKRPACYTQIDSRGHGMPGQVDYCGAAPRCTAKIFSECYEKSTGLDYRGAKAVSKTSGACLSWTNQVKANGKNGFSVLSQGAKQRGIGNHNCKCWRGEREFAVSILAPPSTARCAPPRACSRRFEIELLMLTPCFRRLPRHRHHRCVVLPQDRERQGAALGLLRRRQAEADVRPGRQVPSRLLRHVGEQAAEELRDLP